MSASCSVQRSTANATTTAAGLMTAAQVTALESAVAGGNRDWKESVRVAISRAGLAAYTRVGNVITANANGALGAHNGVTPSAGNRVLLWDTGVSHADHGIYDVTSAGSGGTPYVLTRSSDADASAEVTDALSVTAQEGTAHAGTTFRLITDDAITLNTTALRFEPDPSVNASTVAAAGAVMDTDFAGAGLGRMTRTGAATYAVIVDKLDGTAAPTVNEDSGDGYGVGSFWLDTTNDRAYVCLDATVAAAVWRQIGNPVLDALSGITATEGFYRKTAAGTAVVHKSNLGAVAAPDVTDDSDDGYSIGSIWIDTATDRVYMATDVTIGAAVWREFIGALGNQLISGTKTFDGTLAMADGSLLQCAGRGTGTGDVIERIGNTATEGLELRVFEDTISPAAVETNVVNLPAGSIPIAVLGNVEAALTGGGTTVTWSIGTAGDPDKYGTAGFPTQADSLAKNSKSRFLGPFTQLTSAEQIVLSAAATGGAADGDTALTVGSVRIRVIYWTCNDLDDAP